jgi:hypothetical protein
LPGRKETLEISHGWTLGKKKVPIRTTGTEAGADREIKTTEKGKKIAKKATNPVRLRRGLPVAAGAADPVPRRTKRNGEAEEARR